MEKQISNLPEYAFLKGGGEMASLIAAYNWAEKSIGPISGWSDHLKSSLGMMLKSRFPMLIFWGPELLTFYNDAFRPSLGDNGKHPGSLGQRGEESWAESWPVIGPMIASIMEGGEAVWFEDQKLPLYRDGKMGYAYWTYSFSALTDGDGKIAGILVTCSETTKAVESLEKLSGYAEELAFAVDAAELGTWDLNPATGKFTANNRLKEWFGLKPDDEIPLTWAIDVIAEQDRERVSQEIAKSLVYSSSGRYEITYRIIHPVTHRQRIVLAKGRAWFDENQQPYRFNGTLQDVTEQQLAESRVRLIIEQAPAAICLFTDKKQHIIELANERMLKVWGKTHDVIGKPLLEGIPELIGQPFNDILNEIYETKKPYTGVGTPAKLVVDGKLQTFYFDFTYQPILDSKGEVTGILDIAEDVTEKVKSQKALEEAVLFSSSIVDNSPVAKIVYIGYDMVLNTVNRVMLDLLGKEESIIGKTFEEVFPEFKDTHLLETMRKVYVTGETFVQPEERLELIKNGQPFTGYYSYIYKALRNTDNEIYGMIVTATDITDQVLARQKVEEAEIRLSSAVELAQLSTWSIDVRTNKINYSPRLQEWLGIDEAIHDGPSNRIAEEDRERIFEAIQRAIHSEGKGRFDETFTIVNTQNAHRRIIHAHAQMSYDENHQPLQLAGVAQDITLQKQAQLALEQEVQIRTEELASTNEELMATIEELANTNSNLTDTNKQLEQFAYVASHDLQEPLRKIEVFSSILSEKSNLEPKESEYVRKINRSANRMRYLINDLLEFSRLMHEGEIAMSVVDLKTVVQKVKDDFELTIQEKQAVLRVQELPVVLASSLQMNQLFYNLIGNALKFVDKNTPPDIKIYSELIPAEQAKLYMPLGIAGMNYWKISVQDNGIGIEQEYLDNIFEVFKRLHNKESYSGSGIGLSICKLIVNNHSGRLYCESEFGKGSTFHIILPARLES